MAGSVNRVILIGHLGRDPEVRNTAAGAPIATLSIATSESWRDKATGERKEKTEWHRVVIFAEVLAKLSQQYLKKGSKVYLEGKLRTRKWTDQGGVEKYTTEIVLENFDSTMVILDKREGGPPPADETSFGDRRDSTISTGPVGDGKSRAGGMDDDIPF